MSVVVVGAYHGGAGGACIPSSSVTSLRWGQVTSSWESDGEEDLGIYFNVCSYFLSCGSFLFIYCNDFPSLLLVACCHFHGRRKHNHRLGTREPLEGVDSLEFCLRVIRSQAGALRWGSDEPLRSWLNGGGGYSTNLMLSVRRLLAWDGTEWGWWPNHHGWWHWGVEDAFNQWFRMWSRKANRHCIFNIFI